MSAPRAKNAHRPQPARAAGQGGRGAGARQQQRGRSYHVPTSSLSSMLDASAGGSFQIERNFAAAFGFAASTDVGVGTGPSVAPRKPAGSLLSLPSTNTSHKHYHYHKRPRPVKSPSHHSLSRTVFTKTKTKAGGSAPHRLSVSVSVGESESASGSSEEDEEGLTSSSSEPVDLDFSFDFVSGLERRGRDAVEEGEESMSGGDDEVVARGLVGMRDSSSSDQDEEEEERRRRGRRSLAPSPYSSPMERTFSEPATRHSQLDLQLQQLQLQQLQLQPLSAERSTLVGMADPSQDHYTTLDCVGGVRQTPSSAPASSGPLPPLPTLPPLLLLSPLPPISSTSTNVGDAHAPLPPFFSPPPDVVSPHTLSDRDHQNTCSTTTTPGTPFSPLFSEAGERSSGIESVTDVEEEDHRDPSHPQPKPSLSQQQQQQEQQQQREDGKGLRSGSTGAGVGPWSESPLLLTSPPLSLPSPRHVDDDPVVLPIPARKCSADERQVLQRKGRSTNAAGTGRRVSGCGWAGLRYIHTEGYDVASPATSPVLPSSVQGEEQEQEQEQEKAAGAKIEASASASSAALKSKNKSKGKGKGRHTDVGEGALFLDGVSFGSSGLGLGLDLGAYDAFLASGDAAAGDMEDGDDGGGGALGFDERRLKRLGKERSAADAASEKKTEREEMGAQRIVGLCDVRVSSSPADNSLHFPSPLTRSPAEWNVDVFQSSPRPSPKFPQRQSSEPVAWPPRAAVASPVLESNGHLSFDAGGAFETSPDTRIDELLRPPADLDPMRLHRSPSDEHFSYNSTPPVPPSQSPAEGGVAFFAGAEVPVEAAGREKRRSLAQAMGFARDRDRKRESHCHRLAEDEGGATATFVERLLGSLSTVVGAPVGGGLPLSESSKQIDAMERGADATDDGFVGRGTESGGADESSQLLARRSIRSRSLLGPTRLRVDKTERRLPGAAPLLCSPQDDGRQSGEAEALSSPLGRASTLSPVDVGNGVQFSPDAIWTERTVSEGTPRRRSLIIAGPKTSSDADADAGAVPGQRRRPTSAEVRMRKQKVEALSQKIAANLHRRRPLIQNQNKDLNLVAQTEGQERRKSSGVLPYRRSIVVERDDRRLSDDDLEETHPTDLSPSPGEEPWKRTGAAAAGSLYTPLTSIQSNVLHAVAPVSSADGQVEGDAGKRASFVKVVTAPATWLDELKPSKSLFLLGFLLGPWCWVIGGWWLGPDGFFVPPSGHIATFYDPHEDEEVVPGQQAVVSVPDSAPSPRTPRGSKKGSPIARRAKTIRFAPPTNVPPVTPTSPRSPCDAGARLALHPPPPVPCVALTRPPSPTTSDSLGSSSRTRTWSPAFLPPAGASLRASSVSSSSGSRRSRWRHWRGLLAVLSPLPKFALFSSPARTGAPALSTEVWRTRTEVEGVATEAEEEEERQAAQKVEEEEEGWVKMDLSDGSEPVIADGEGDGLKGPFQSSTADPRSGGHAGRRRLELFVMLNRVAAILSGSAVLFGVILAITIMLRRH